MQLPVDIALQMALFVNLHKCQEERGSAEMAITRTLAASLLLPRKLQAARKLRKVKSVRINLALTRTFHLFRIMMRVLRKKNHSIGQSFASVNTCRLFISNLSSRYRSVIAVYRKSIYLFWEANGTCCAEIIAKLNTWSRTGNDNPFHYFNVKYRSLTALLFLFGTM